MTYTYGTHGAPAVGGGLPGLPQRNVGSRSSGEFMFVSSSSAASTNIVVPDGVTSICAVAIGQGESLASGLISGRGGCLRWANDIPVTPGALVTLANTATGVQLSVSGVLVLAASYLSDAANTTPLGPNAGGYVVGGGNGGAAGTGSASVGGAGGGGAGGYFGNGGNSGGTGAGGSASADSAAGGAGGGGRYASLVKTYQSGGGGGGVGPYGVLDSPARTGIGGGIGDAASGYFGRNGGDGEGIPVGASKFGGGMGGRGSSNPGVAQPGCVRVIFGEGRSFPYNAR